jgi:hypothetical protein
MGKKFYFCVIGVLNTIKGDTHLDLADRDVSNVSEKLER